MARTTAARLAAIAAIAAAATLLAGCTFGTPKPTTSALPTVEIDSPAVPDALEQPGSHVVSRSLVGPQGNRPALLATSIQQPGASPALVLWTSSDGRTWTKGSLRSSSKAAVTDVFVVASDRYTLAGGTSWSRGVIRPVLYGSSDRSRWSSVPLPDGIGAGFRVTASAVIGTRIVLIATDAGGRSIGATRSGGKWSRIAVPSVSKGTLLSPSSLLGTAKQLVLTARPGREGAASPLVAYRSTDGGRHWSSPVTIADKTATVYGAVATSSGYVVTGALPASGSVVERPTSWSSSDGSTWTASALGAPAEDASHWEDIADVWLGPPTVGADGSVAAVMSNDNAAISTVWTRGADGGWSERAQSPANSASGEDGLAYTVSDGRIGVLLGSGTWLRVAAIAGGWAEGTVFAARAPSFVAGSAAPLGGQVVVPVNRPVFQVAADLRWTNSSESQAATIAGGGRVAAAAAVPGEASGLRALVYGSSGTASVALGWSWDGVGPTLTGGFARVSGSSWAPVSGFLGDGSTIPSAVAKAGNTWVAAVRRRSSTNVGTVEHAAVFTSPDGLTWTAAAGDFGSGQLETQISDVCATSDGTPLGIGYVQRGAGEYSPAVWKPSAGTWARVDLGRIGAADGYLESCSHGSGPLTVSGTVSGRSTILTANATGKLTSRFTAPRGDYIGAPAKVAGGYAASGSHGAGRASQAVVWLSTTGRDWTPVAVPTLRSGETIAVAPLGKDLVVTMSPEVGHPVVLVRGIAKVIRERVKGVGLGKP